MRYIELFQKKKDLMEKLNAVVKQEWFQECLTYVRGELMDDGKITTDELTGAKKFENLLLTMTDVEGTTHFPRPKIHHDLDAKPITTRPEQVQRKD